MLRKQGDLNNQALGRVKPRVTPGMSEVRVLWCLSSIWLSGIQLTVELVSCGHPGRVQNRAVGTYFTISIHG